MFYLSQSTFILLALIMAVCVDVGKSYGQEHIALDPPFRLKNVTVFENGERWSVGGSGQLNVRSHGSTRTYKISDTDLNSIFFIDSKKAIIVGDRGEILVTYDRGKTWQKQRSDTDANLQSVYCVNLETCWIVADERGILLSGGPNKIWKVEIAQNLETNMLSQVSQPNWRGSRIVSDGSFEDVYFVDVLVGYAVGRGGLVLKTLDGGNEWVRINIPSKLRVTEFINGVPNFDSVAFLDPLIGCIAGWDVGTDIVACTKDGGESWNISTMGSRPIGVVWKKPRVFVVDENWTKSTSTDNGKSWSLLK